MKISRDTRISDEEWTPPHFLMDSSSEIIIIYLVFIKNREYNPNYKMPLS